MKCKYCKSKKVMLLECKYCNKEFCVSCIEIIKHKCKKSDNCRKRKRDELEETLLSQKSIQNKVIKI